MLGRKVSLGDVADCDLRALKDAYCTGWQDAIELVYILLSIRSIKFSFRCHKAHKNRMPYHNAYLLLTCIFRLVWSRQTYVELMLPLYAHIRDFHADRLNRSVPRSSPSHIRSIETIYSITAWSTETMWWAY